MDIIRSLVHMLAGAKKSTDTEQGVPVPQAGSITSDSLFDPYGKPEIKADDKLALYRHLTGITSHVSMKETPDTDGNKVGRKGENMGIYGSVLKNEKDAKKEFNRTALLINGCLGLQIIVAASLTALGAAGASHAAVTVFGAINTVIAGILTFTKGSGLPNRIKYYESEWKRIREEIEQRERDFSRPGCILNVDEVVHKIETMYSELKMEIEASTPDRFAGISSSRKNAQQAELPHQIEKIGGGVGKVDAMDERLKRMEEAMYESGNRKLVSKTEDEFHQAGQNVVNRAHRAKEDAVDRIHSAEDTAGNYQPYDHHVNRDTEKE